MCYNKIVDIERNLITKCGNADKAIRDEAKVIRDKFEKYWDGFGNINTLLTVASVFDPRNKMKFASLCFDQLYGKDTIESRKLNALVSSVMTSLYEEDQTDSQPHPTNFELSDDEDDCEGMLALFDKVVDLKGNEDSCNELQMYLTEKIEGRVENKLVLPYDILSWWRRNCPGFPILSEFARNVLAIQASSVASESAFSTSGRVLDPYRSSLTPYMVEVLLCTQQWLRCSYKKEGAVANLVQMLEEVDFFESLCKFDKLFDLFFSFFSTIEVLITFDSVFFCRCSKFNNNSCLDSS